MANAGVVYTTEVRLGLYGRAIVVLLDAARPSLPAERAKAADVHTTVLFRPGGFRAGDLHVANQAAVAWRHGRGG
eukprot:CAMPEP_0170158114 /NCGR_PEP_ID=MMETSP0033_2-20121228/67509_1 /TAXON_ID=195969 /ORGANISM="Dolichomastix tenuilepis, Strain CCMP3274" /LENGTH=74 /DNA_ID=CAMNT_0010395533 /DNA_START=48 /DNA_END=268 /DNA_ORIENTATION=+